jgi:hypothetical protein
MEPELIADTVESLQISFDEKANNIAMLNANLNGDILAIDEQVKRLQSMKKSIVSKQDALKEYLRYNMAENGITSIKCPVFSVSLRKALKVVDITDIDLIPDEYVNVVTTITPDKKLIAKALKDGVEIKGAKLVDGKQGLTIK